MHSKKKEFLFKEEEELIYKIKQKEKKKDIIDEIESELNLDYEQIVEDELCDDDEELV